MNKSQINKTIKSIEKHMKAVAKERDAIDDTISELRELSWDCEAAHNCLIEARDVLSELV